MFLFWLIIVYIFQNVAVAMVAVGTVFSTLFHVFVKEKEHASFATQEQRIINQADEMVEKPHLTWKDWFFQPQFYMVILNLDFFFIQ